MTIKLHLCYKVICDFVLFDCLFVCLFETMRKVFCFPSGQFGDTPGDQEALLVISGSWQGHTEKGLTRDTSSSH